MTLLKLVIGLMSGSLAVLADAMHSATDGLSSLLGLITNGLSDPRPDRDHPYGHDKYEGLGAVAIAGFILFTAFEILRTAVERIAHGLQPLRLDGHQLLVLLVVLVLLMAFCGVSLAAVNINTASKEELDSLKGIGPVKAQAIVDYRTKNGPFRSVDDLEKVPGIGPKTLADIRKDVTISGASTPSSKPAATPAAAPAAKASEPSKAAAAPTSAKAPEPAKAATPAAPAAAGKAPEAPKADAKKEPAKIDAPKAAAKSDEKKPDAKKADTKDEKKGDRKDEKKSDKKDDRKTDAKDRKDDGKERKDDKKSEKK